MEGSAGHEEAAWPSLDQVDQLTASGQGVGGGAQYQVPALRPACRSVRVDLRTCMRMLICICAGGHIVRV